MTITKHSQQTHPTNTSDKTDLFQIATILNTTQNHQSMTIQYVQSTYINSENI